MYAQAGDSVHLSVVIPAYNEARRLPRTLRAVVEYLIRQPYGWEVLVVDDGSRDATADVVRALQRVEPRVSLWRYATNRGKGYAVRYGMQRARGRYRLFMDADNSTTVEHVERFFRDLESGYDVVIGSRGVPGATVAVHQPRWKEWLGEAGNIWIQLLAVPGIRDTQAGFKVCRAEVVIDVFPHLLIDRWGFDVELLAAARHRGWRIAERPIRWVNDLESKVKGTAYVQVLWEVLNVRLNMWRGRYSAPSPQAAARARAV